MVGRGMSDNVYDFNAEELAMNDDYYNYLTKQREGEPNENDRSTF